MSEADVLDFLRAQFAQVNKRLDGIDNRLDELTRRVADLEVEVSAIRRDLAHDNEKAVAMQHQMDRFSTRLAKIERRLEINDKPA